MDDAFRRGDNIQPPGVGYRMVTVTTPDGSPVITHKGTIEEQAEVDPDAAAWIVRGTELIARDGKSPIDVARLFNEHQVAGRQPNRSEDQQRIVRRRPTALISIPRCSSVRSAAVVDSQ